MSLRGGCSSQRSNPLAMGRLPRRLGLDTWRQGATLDHRRARNDIDSLISLSTFVPVFPLRVPSFVFPPLSRLPMAGPWSDAHHHPVLHTQGKLYLYVFAHL